MYIHFRKTGNLGNPALNQKTRSHYFEEPKKGESAYDKKKKKYTDFVLCFPGRKKLIRRKMIESKTKNMGAYLRKWQSTVILSIQTLPKSD